jgi:hypothetical protein
MSPEVERLQFAARRYCIDRSKLWAEKYQRLVEVGSDRRGPRYTPEAYRTFPRYQVLNAIRTELERLTGTDVGNLDEARELFAQQLERVQVLRRVILVVKIDDGHGDFGDLG